MTPQQILDLKQKILALDADLLIQLGLGGLPTLLAYCEELEGKVNVAEKTLTRLKHNLEYPDEVGDDIDYALATLNPSNP